MLGPLERSVVGVERTGAVAPMPPATPALPPTWPAPLPPPAPAAPPRRTPSKRERLAAAACLLPSMLADHPLLLRARLYARVYWLPPGRIAGKPGPAGPWAEVRRADIALLERMEAGVVVDGDWDLEPRPFVPQAVVDELFGQRLPRERTPTFQRMARAVAEGDWLRARGYRSMAEVHRYFDRLEALHASILRDGFRSQRELGRSPDEEVAVCIGRTGAVLLMRDGNHRTSIAQVEGVDRIAVRVVGVHREWVRARQAEYGDPNLVRAVERGLGALLRG